MTETRLHIFDAFQTVPYPGTVDGPVITVEARSHAMAARSAAAKLGCGEGDVVLRYRWPVTEKMFRGMVTE